MSSEVLMHPQWKTSRKAHSALLLLHSFSLCSEYPGNEHVLGLSSTEVH